MADLSTSMSVSMSLPLLPPAGEDLLRRVLALLADQVEGALAAVLAVAHDPAPLVVVAGALAGAEPVARLTALLTRRPGGPGGDVTTPGGEEGALLVPPDAACGPGLVAVRTPGEDPLVVGVVLDRAPAPPDADRVRRALPAVVAAVGVVREWAAERERAEQMVQMVQYRRVIEQAKGLVMGATGADAAAAFATLARASQHFNVRLRSLAVALVELAGGGPAEGPDDPAAVVVPGERERRAAATMWAALSGGPAPVVDGV